MRADRSGIVGSALSYCKPCNFLQIVFPRSPPSHVNSSEMPPRITPSLINCHAEFTVSGSARGENRRKFVSIILAARSSRRNSSRGELGGPPRRIQWKEREGHFRKEEVNGATPLSSRRVSCVCDTRAPVWVHPRAYVRARCVTSRKSMTHLHLLFLFLPLLSASSLLSFCTARTAVVCSDIPPSKPLVTSAYFPRVFSERVRSCVPEEKNS